MHLAKLALVTMGLATATAAAQPAPPAPPPPPPPEAPPPEAPLPPGDAPPSAMQPQPAAPAPMPAPQPVPIAPQRAVSQSVLPGVLPTAVGTTLEGRIDLSNLGGDADFDVTFVALNLHGQYIAPLGFGGYFGLPIATVSGDSDTETYLGNLQAGGLYVFRGRDVEGYVRLGFAVGLTDDEDDFGGAIAAPIANLVPRPADAYTTGLNTSWIRGGGGLRFESGGLVVGGAAGVDFLLDSEEQENGLLHLAGSIGAAQPAFGVAAGFTLLQILDDGEGDDDSVLSFQVVGDVAVGGGARVFGAIGLNFEDDLDGYSFGAGVRATIF